MIKIEKGLDTNIGSWFFEYRIRENIVLQREKHIRNDGQVTSITGWIEIDPWENGLEIERIKNL